MQQLHLARNCSRIWSYYGEEVAEILRNNFYVDDVLKSISNEEGTIKQIQGVENVFSDWVSTLQIL